MAQSKQRVRVKTEERRQLDPSRRSKDVEDFESALRHLVVGQDPAIDAVVNLFQAFKAGLNPPNRPIGTLLFLGPTGSGKTVTIEKTVETLFGSSLALLKVDCAEFQHSHEISKLIGSPPGYLGHKETHPVLTQEAINQYQTENLRLTFILFDEIEKASDSLWNLLLGILDKGTLTLGDNRRIDMSSCVIVMTSNVGAAEMSSLVNGGMGFVTNKKIDSGFDTKIQSTAVQAARRKFSPEFMNRIDKTVVFNTLRQEHLEKILELELEAIQLRILRAQSNGQFNKQFIFECNEEVKKYLLHEGTDPQYGARHLKRVIERALVSPLSNLIATGQINIGDLIRVSLDKENEFHFTVETENSIVPTLLANIVKMRTQAG
jgi:ATP-dependent Clp protease ATP-binding subunit ClpA